MNNYRDSESIEDLLQSFDREARGIECKYRNAGLGQVVDGLNKSDSIDLNIEHGRQALHRLADPWTKVEDGLPEESKNIRYRVWVKNTFNDGSYEVHARYFDNNWWQGYNPSSLIGGVTAYQPITAPGE